MPDEPKRQRFPYRAQVELLKDRVKLLEDLVLQSQQQVAQALSNGTASVSQQQQRRQQHATTSATCQEVAFGIPEVQQQQQGKDEYSSSSDPSSPRVLTFPTTTTSLGILDPEIAPLEQYSADICSTDIWSTYPSHTPQSSSVPTADTMHLATPTLHPPPIQQSQRRLSNLIQATSRISKVANDSPRSFTRPRLPSSSSNTTTNNRRPFLKPIPALSSPRLDLTQIPREMVSHLLTLYFRRHQLLFKLVPEAAFYRDLAAGQGPSYTPSLLCAMLAAGLRYSDKAEPFLLANGQGDVFSQRSKELLETELKHADMRTVVTLLISGELETARGNDMTAYLYGTFAQRLVFDLHLDLNGVEQELSDTDVEIRYWLVWCASVQDQYWALT